MKTKLGVFQLLGGDTPCQEVCWHFRGWHIHPYSERECLLDFTHPVSNEGLGLCGLFEIINPVQCDLAICLHVDSNISKHRTHNKLSQSCADDSCHELQFGQSDGFDRRDSRSGHN